MPKLNLHRRDYTSILSGGLDAIDLEKAFRPNLTKSSLRLTPSPYLTDRNLDKRWEKLSSMTDQVQLLDPSTLVQKDAYSKNIEHFIGTVKVPVGIAGPLRVNGLFANDDYLVPLATTEAALVASYNRGRSADHCSGRSQRYAIE